MHCCYLLCNDTVQNLFHASTYCDMVPEQNKKYSLK